MNHEYIVNDINLSFFLTKEKRKTLSLNILPDGSLIVKSPLFVNLKEIKMFVFNHISWVTKKRQSLLNLKEKIADNYENGSKVFYCGNEYKLRIEQDLIDKVIIEDDTILVLSTRSQNQRHIKKNLELWYLNQAKAVFNERLCECLHNFSDLKLPYLTIRNMKGRWGSYHSKHKVTLNLKLIKTPKRCIDYVVIHELCHVYHMNHGKEFKKLLESKIPNWKEIKKELNLFAAL